MKLLEEIRIWPRWRKESGSLQVKERSDLLIKNGRVVDVFSGQIEKKDVAIFGGVIVGFGDYRAREIIDVKGDFLCPGLIDGHVHIESSMVTIPEFARAVLPNGTTSVVIDPHEIANVLGQRAFASWRNRQRRSFKCFHHGSILCPCHSYGNIRGHAQGN